ncbi:retropepsin-like aspartic protease family protein [Pseudomonas sp. N040]|uniref:retropepsin-like aspartic protease family protein n=1 Tax=Pseudomonas sp. N040 TaxID=2785325 RepID=UPI0018A258CF|nr:TIGR02281 family clan AA aspartic protease [Pseudomonas sp. N040]MBF7730909.1 TIGR02281 family clan AA aspartic protease [Pseudomonas sp. N040]MBW7014552.1 TIGR02281 family clan AA aspartic protease [Pseudomonas sp. N040]
MARFQIFMAICLLALHPQGQAAPQVQVVGLFPGAAVISVDGQRKLLKVGQSGPAGVQLISADSRSAVLRVEGVESRYTLSRDYSATSGQAAAPAKVSIAKGLGGHYWVAGSISGTSMQFLVDTGATAVAMNEAAARRLGIDYRIVGQPVVVNTASGTAQAWRVKLGSVKVGAIEVLGVDAAVLEGEAPTEVLLGMSFLNRVRWREEQGMLQLEAKY